jgi:hypothetical protein
VCFRVVLCNSKKNLLTLFGARGVAMYGQLEGLFLQIQLCCICFSICVDQLYVGCWCHHLWHVFARRVAIARTPELFPWIAG